MGYLKGVLGLKVSLPPLMLGQELPKPRCAVEVGLLSPQVIKCLQEYSQEYGLQEKPYTTARSPVW